MYFVMTLSRMPVEHEVVLVIVDRLTMSIHFISLKVGCFLAKLAKIYVREMVNSMVCQYR